MNGATLAALITSITALITALHSILAQIGHLHWHSSAAKPVQVQIPPAAPVESEK